MHIKYIDMKNIDSKQWNNLSDKDRAQKIKAVAQLVTYNAFTKYDLVFLLKEAVRLAETGAFEKTEEK